MLVLVVGTDSRKLCRLGAWTLPLHADSARPWRMARRFASLPVLLACATCKHAYCDRCHHATAMALQHLPVHYRRPSAWCQRPTSTAPSRYSLSYGLPCPSLSRLPLPFSLSSRLLSREFCQKTRADATILFISASSFQHEDCRLALARSSLSAQGSLQPTARSQVYVCHDASLQIPVQCSPDTSHSNCRASDCQWRSRLAQVQRAPASYRWPRGWWRCCVDYCAHPTAAACESRLPRNSILGQPEPPTNIPKGAFSLVACLLLLLSWICPLGSKALAADDRFECSSFSRPHATTQNLS